MPIMTVNLQCDTCQTFFAIEGADFTPYTSESDRLIYCDPCQRLRIEAEKTADKLKRMDITFTVSIHGAEGHIRSMLEEDLEAHFDHLQECNWFKSYSIDYGLKEVDFKTAARYVDMYHKHNMAVLEYDRVTKETVLSRQIRPEVLGVHPIARVVNVPEGFWILNQIIFGRR